MMATTAEAKLFSTFLTAHLVPREWRVVYRFPETGRQVASPLTLQEAAAWMVDLTAWPELMEISLERIPAGEAS